MYSSSLWFNCLNKTITVCCIQDSGNKNIPSISHHAPGTWNRKVRGAPESSSHVAIGTHLCPSHQKSPPPGFYSPETLKWNCRRLHAEAHNSVSIFPGCFHSVLEDHNTFYFSFSFFISFSSTLQRSHMSSTWLSGGSKKWTPAGRRLDPHLKTTTFISRRQSQTVAGLWTYRPTPRRFTTTRLWLTLVGRCPETSKR